MNNSPTLVLNVTGLTMRTAAGLALNNVSFALEKSRRLAIAGETGAGKSTLLKIVGGIVQASTGTVTFEGIRLKGPEEQLMPGNKGVAYLSQQYELRNNYRVWELLEIANKINPDAANEIYGLCRIDGLLQRKTSDLSGGEKQRISLAMLLIAKPRLLLLDEPFSNLDPIHKRLLKMVLNDAGNELGLTCILASHEPQDTLSWADEMIGLKDGSIVQHGTPEMLYQQPVNEYMAGLLGPYQLFSVNEAAHILPGSNTFPENKKLLVRPEHFRIVNYSDGALTGIVKDIRFMGSYYEIIVQLQGLYIHLHSINSRLSIGDSANIAYDAGQAWYI